MAQSRWLRIQSVSHVFALTLTKNLEFFVGLRNKIEHRFLPQLDPDIFGECQAMLINFETLLSEEFGAKQAVGADFPFALQFSEDNPTRAANSYACCDAGTT